MFNTLLTTFQGFFSRSFWFGSFLPVAMFAAVNLVLASLAFPAHLPLSSWAANLDQWAYFPAVVVALTVLAYVLRPFVPLLRGILDGTFLPGWLHDSLRLPRLRQAESIRAEVNAAWQLRAFYQEERAPIVKRLADSRTAGLNTKQAAGSAAIAAAVRAVDALSGDLRAGTIPSAGDVEAATDLLDTALKANSAKLDPQHTDAANATRLGGAVTSMRNFLRHAQADSAYRHTILSARHSEQKLVAPEATRVGDARVLAEQYSLEMYEAEFDYLWPRLQLVLPDDKTDRFAARVIDVESQIHFSVLSLGLCFSLFAWLPVLAVQQRVVAFLILATVLPILVRFLYELVVRSQVAFGEVVKTAIDKYRRAVLVDLHMRSPPTLFAERALWRRLSRGAEGSDLTFV